jgi:hypothetical protein
MRPSSSTSSSRFLKAFVPPVLAVGLGLIGATFARDLQPKEGDLATMGVFPERDYGWNGLQPRWAGPPPGGPAVTRTHDLLVIGDSFSRARPYWVWQHAFTRATGLATYTVEQELILQQPHLAAFLQGPAYAAYPPRLLVIKCVERHLVGNYGETELPALPVAPRHPAPLAWRPAPGYAPTRTARATQSPGFDMVATKNLLLAEAWRALDQRQASLWSKPLTRSDLFSSRVADRTLFYTSDGEKRGATPESIARTGRNLARLVRLAEANGRTRCLFLIAPDKSTAYGPYLADPSQRLPNLIPGVAATCDALLPRLDLRLGAQIGAGKRDVYLPNDTHWSGETQVLVGEAIADAFIGAGALVPRR